MRDWLTPRCILVALLLVVAPTMAVTHVLVSWLPARVAVRKMDRQVARAGAQLETELDQAIQLQAEIQRLRQAEADTPESWLPQRWRDAVFDGLAAALDAPDVDIERLTLEEPGLYAAAARGNLLACERGQITCVGNYEALTACLDRITALPWTVRVTQLARQAGIQEALLATMPRLFPQRVQAPGETP